MAASVVKHLFIPSLHLSFILYALVLLLSDFSFSCSIALIGLVISIIFFLRYALPRIDTRRVFDFYSTSDSRQDELDGVDSKDFGDFSLRRNSSAKVFIAAHRTLAMDAPENSISGIQKACSGGFNGVEFDVRLSSDQVMVLFHDPTIDRVTDSLGEVKNLSTDQMRLLDISANHLQSADFEGERVPTLDEAVEECLQLQLKMFIDVKEPSQKILSGLRDLFTKYPELVDQAMVVCASPFFLYQLRSLNAEILTGLVWRPRIVSLQCPTGVLDHACPRFNERWKQVVSVAVDAVLDWAIHSLVWYMCGICTILAHKDAINREYLKMWRSRGIEVLAWPVNDPTEKQYLANVQKIGYLTDTLMPYP